MSIITVSDPVSEEEQELSETPDQDGDGTLSRTEEPEDLTPGDPLDRILRRVEAEKEKTGRPSKIVKKLSRSRIRNRIQCPDPVKNETMLN